MWWWQTAMHRIVNRQDVVTFAAASSQTRIVKSKTAAIEQGAIEALRVTPEKQNNCSNRYLPGHFHDWRGYDSRLILKKAFGIAGVDAIHAISDSDGNCVTFSISEIKFRSVSNVRLLLKPCSKKIKNARETPSFKILDYATAFWQEQLKWICRKGFCPFKSWARHEKLSSIWQPPTQTFEV